MDWTLSASIDQAQLQADIILSINLGNSLNEVFTFLYDRLHKFVPYSRIAIALIDEKREKLSILAAKSDGKIVLGEGYAGLIDGSSLGPLVREGKTRIINDLEEHLAKKPSSEATRLIVKEGMRSSLTLPLLVQGQPIGVMFFSSRMRDAYRAEHEEFLRGIVGHMAIAVEKSRLMDALREKTEHLENILRNSADAIVVFDAEDRLTSWSEGAKRIFGYEAPEVLGRDSSMFVPPEERGSPGTAAVKQIVERDGHLKDHECIRLAKDGSRIVVSVNSTLLRDKRGRVIGRSSIVRDITHLKKLQQDLLNAQCLAAVGELAATVAHEIKNPLASLSGAIQVLQDEIPESSPRRAVVREILEQVRRLDSTVRDLLSFARPVKPTRHEIDLGESLRQAWSLLSQEPGAAQVRFAFEGSEGVRISLDSDLLNQVWINLYQNAIEAMPEGGDLSVRVTPGATVSVEIRDTGGGIDPANVPRLFRPFFTTKTRGTGLGLAITRKLVEAHGGTVRIESQLRQGTTVWVELPR